MGEIGVSKELRDRIQNHALQDVSSKHYDRYDYLVEKRRALEQWENRVNHVEQATSNVVNLFQRGWELAKYSLNSLKSIYQPGSSDSVLLNRLSIIDEAEFDVLSVQADPGLHFFDEH